jgi:hypothetical protein
MLPAIIAPDHTARQTKVRIGALVFCDASQGVAKMRLRLRHLVWSAPAQNGSSFCIWGHSDKNGREIQVVSPGNVAQFMG